MKKPSFTLSMKDQKGQVAIFVALIFQVIFVFFALLINIGLIVHHKINLQQSTDLAAYYGAMKQAESLNAIAHINFQIRQAWKLLAWRYRIVGTFGFQATNSGSDPKPVFPVTLIYDGSGNSKVNPPTLVNSGACAPDSMNTATHPFFCIGHAGFKGWRGGVNENTCKVDCGLINDTGDIPVPGVTRMTNIAIDNGISSRVASAIDSVNTNLQNLCQTVGKVNITVLATMLMNYRRETQARSQTLLMLAANLSNRSEDLLDLDGESVLKGVTTTLQNNLTEANRSSMPLSAIKSYNSLSDPSCSMERGPDAGNKNRSKKEFLKRIEFAIVQFLIHDCEYIGNSQNFRSGSIFHQSFTKLADGTPIGTRKTPKLNGQIDAAVEQEILSLITNENEKFTVGYEKNPWCPSYFAVTSTAEPKIPFLPLAKVKLVATSVAKPFGGTVGPWFGKTWAATAPTSQEGLTAADNAKQVDLTLPIVNNTGGTPIPRRDSHRLLINFSRFVGDTKGLSDPEYVGKYHGALINRVPKMSSGLSYTSSKPADTSGTGTFRNLPSIWPSLDSWDNAYDMTDATNYDPLTKNGNSDSYFRDLEISSIAPNQFDLSYYSIDPDFYNNYYRRLSNQTIFNKLKSAAGMGPNDARFVRPDFGNNKNIYSIEDFSVKNQIEVVKKIFASGFSTGLDDPKPTFIDSFPYLVTKQSSLLSGWTFKNLTDFKTFPGDELDSANTMSFGLCSDPWQDSPRKDSNATKFESPVRTNQPAVPGNCVTGGRTGYSVKLVTPATLRSGIAQPLGGGEAGSVVSGEILNPIPNDMINF